MKRKRENGEIEEEKNNQKMKIECKIPKIWNLKNEKHLKYLNYLKENYLKKKKEKEKEEIDL